MYNLGEQFKRDYKVAEANPKCIVQGKKYRITVLTEGLLRLEFSKEGIFNSLPTELVWFRNFPVPEYTVREDGNFLELTTKKLKLTYVKEKPFKGSLLNPIANLKVQVNGSDKMWYYGHPEVRNYGAPDLAYDTNGDTFKFGKGLYSLDGFAAIDDSKSLIFEETGTLVNKNKDSVDVYLFMYGTDFNSCLKDYYALTGKPALLPRYALGNWWSKNANYSSKEILNLVEDFHYYKIPLSVVLLNNEWHINKFEKKDKLASGFTWNPLKHENPLDFVNKIHSYGIRLGLSIDPTSGIYPYEQYYQKAIQYLGLKDQEVIPFNVLDARTLDVYLKLFIHPLDAMGTDFFFLDIEDKDKLKDLSYLDHYHFYDMKRDYKRRPMLLTRNNKMAPHRYPVAYSGKTIVGWDTLKQIPFYNSSAANIGLSYFSHDIGGFHKGIEDNELYVRFVQLGVFSSIFKFGSEHGKYYKREPWLWSIKTHNITKDFLTLRHKMIPYLYTEAYEYYTNGKPLIEPIYYRHPDLYDDDNFKNEYFFGSAFLVSPIVNRKDFIMNRVIHKFFIPDGIWYDFFTGKKFPGGKSYVSFFKDQDYPVFAKAGAIIPFGTNDDVNDTNPPKNMEIQIFPGVDNTYKLYEDDGASDLYHTGYYLLSSIEYNYMPNNYTVIVRALEGKSGIVPASRNYKFRFRNTKKADDVTAYFNNEAVACKAYVDGTDFIVDVLNIKTIGQLTINCKGQDIEIDAVRIINDDIATIISDLQIKTELKEKIDEVLFGNLSISKKRIAIRKLKRIGLERKFVKLFLKLLEYIKQV